ncbi:hypothetical protein BB561_001943 [Smittium simulii]|uniref:Uncharacterized protein n=1 Tax=Smittium simulii TaxID=133385 RepID=A0A2T9YS98_9FUNG|nr:hypothetical protein BB561_001943 [Smittium simulii]
MKQIFPKNENRPGYIFKYWAYISLASVGIFILSKNLLEDQRKSLELRKATLKSRRETYEQIVRQREEDESLDNKN